MDQGSKFVVSRRRDNISHLNAKCEVRLWTGLKYYLTIHLNCTTFFTVFIYNYVVSTYIFFVNNTSGFLSCVAKKIYSTDLWGLFLCEILYKDCCINFVLMDILSAGRHHLSN